MKLLTLSLLTLGLTAMPTIAADKVETRVFELRTYTAPAGKMKDLHARFRDHTCKLICTFS